MPQQPTLRCQGSSRGINTCRRRAWTRSRLRGWTASLRLPADTAPAKGDQEDKGAKGEAHSRGTMVAEKTVVLDSACDVNPGAHASSTDGRFAAPGPSSAPSSSEIAADHLALERGQLLKLGLSSGVAATILSGQRDSTVRIYNHTWKVFHRWCVRRGRDPLSADHRVLLEFLQDGLDKGLKPATLRRQLAALDSVLSVHWPSTFFGHPLMGKFLKGAVAK